MFGSGFVLFWACFVVFGPFVFVGPKKDNRAKQDKKRTKKREPEPEENQKGQRRKRGKTKRGRKKTSPARVQENIPWDHGTLTCDDCLARAKVDMWRLDTAVVIAGPAGHAAVAAPAAVRPVDEQERQQIIASLDAAMAAIERAKEFVMRA